jgi:hypothetical protein
MATAGRSLELYYIDGRPDGMLTAEMFNWTGHVLMAPRTQLADALVRIEASYAGVYLLLGEREGEPLAYVGEGEDISARIKSHDVAKDWWTSAILVTTAGNKLNKAHVRYLEARLIEEASKIKRTPLDNGNSPSRPSLSEADIAKMEAFLENLLVVLPALRVDMFIERARPAPATVTPTAVPLSPAPPTFRFEVKKHDLRASARLENGEFIVMAGSTARKQWEGAITSYTPLHEELVRSNVLVERGDQRVFAADYAFSSPSAAAAVIAGRSANGATSWVTDDGQTYKMWEASCLQGTQ